MTCLKNNKILQVVEEPTYLDEYLTLTLKEEKIYKSIRRARQEILKLNHTNVHMYIWFTNLPTMNEEEHLNEKSPGGITGNAKDPVFCTRGKNVALVRGPSRLDQNTAGVRNTKMS